MSPWCARRRGLASAPPAHFNEAQAEQALWKEFRDHGASLNNALNEALRIHTGPAWQIFKVHVLIIEFEVSLVASTSVHFLTLLPLAPCLSLIGAGGPGSREV
jgi:hypothetical protein